MGSTKHLTNGSAHQTPDEMALQQMRQMSESVFRSEVVQPLLKSIGTHVQEVHGHNEEGKDFLYVIEDHFKEPVLEVCQVKNSPFSGSSSSSSNVTVALTQLRQCLELEVLNPATNTRERPQSACLISTYPLPDTKTKSAGPILAELRRLRCKVVGPDKLLGLLRDHVPGIYSSLAFPGQELSRVLAEYVSEHHEASAFNVAANRQLHEFFVDLGLDAGWDEPRANLPLDAFPVEVPRRDYDQIMAYQKVLPSPLRSFGLLEVDEPIGKKYATITGIDLGGFERLALREGEDRLAESKSEAISFFWHANEFLDFAFLTLGLTEPWAPVLNWLGPVTPLDSVPPEDVARLGDSIVLVAEVGSGKTSLARSTAQVALASGDTCVYFPCFMIDRSLGLFDNIVGFLSGLSPDSSEADVREYVLNAHLLVIDGLDEAPGFGERFADEISDLFVQLCGEEAAHATISEKASALSIPRDIQEVVSVRRLSEDVSDVRLLGPMRMIDFARLAEGNPAVRGEFTNWMSAYERCAPSLLLTTRDDAMLQFSERPLRLALSPFTNGQLETFLERWTGSPDDAHRLMRFLRKNPHILEACRRPMTATLLASMHLSGVNLPRSKSELYSRHFELLLERWDRAKGLKREFSVTPKDKLALLSRLALVMHTDRRRTFGQAEFKSLWNDGPNSVYPDVEAEELLEELRVGNGLVSRLAADTYSLGHLSLQEYLAANGALQSQQERLLLLHFQEPWWREVLVFYAGCRGDISSMLDRLQRTHGLVDSHGLIEEMLLEARFTSQVVRSFVVDAGAYFVDDEEPTGDEDLDIYLGSQEIRKEVEDDS